MKYSLGNLTIEVTRKCNINCKHCMRGDAQNIQITEEIIDQVFDSNNIVSIDNLLFSGGEPTLNEDIIVYIIDKIIESNMDVRKVSIVTNGAFYSERIVEAFKKFNNYRNERVIREIKEKYQEDDFSVRKLIFENSNGHVVIAFSNDQFHGDMRDVINEYYNNASEFKYVFKGNIKDENLYKTGRSNEGKEFVYSIEPLRYYESNDEYFIADYIYVTALGYYESNGNGSYVDMDKLNMGSVFEKSVEDILIQYGNPLYHTHPIPKKLSLHN